jgi:hypothetical protein
MRPRALADLLVGARRSVRRPEFGGNQTAIDVHDATTVFAAGDQAWSQPVADDAPYSSQAEETPAHVLGDLAITALIQTYACAAANDVKQRNN